MGLGKTLQAISVAYYYQNEWPLLIIVPTALRYPWIEELEKWLPELQPNDVNLIASGTDVSNIPNCKVSIIGYGLFRNDSKTMMEAITNQHFRVVIIDESHYMKNGKAARTKLLIPIIQEAKRAILLTGTPALGRPSELFTQINSIRPNMMGSWSQFAKRYCDAHWQYYGRTKRSWDTSGASNLDELHHKLKGSIMIRREKKIVLTQLPPKRRQKVPFELAESADKKEIEKCWLAMRELWKPVPEDAEHAVNPTFQIRTLAGRMYVLTGKAKIGAVCEYVKMLLENQGLKFLVFAHHKEVMTALAQTVMAYQREHKSKLKYIRIDGDVPSLERMHLVHQFQNDEDTRVAILSILAAGTGLTFTAANQVVFAELHWTPGILEQCEDRAHRIGQINSIHVHYLVARGTMDEWIWSALSRKVSVLSSALNGKLQQLKMEEGGEEYADLLKHAAAWLPSNLDDEEDDSFYFTQRQNKTQDIRKFFTPSGTTKGKKRKRSGKGSPKVSKTSGSNPSTPLKCSKLILEQSPIVFDIDDDIGVSEPIQNSTISAACENQDRRSSLEDFVDPVGQLAIRKTMSCDITEQEAVKGRKSGEKACSRTYNKSTKTNISSNFGENQPGLDTLTTTIASGTEDDLPVMKSVIRRRPKKRKSSFKDDISGADENLSAEVNRDLPSCSRVEGERGQSSSVTTRCRVRQEDCVTPIRCPSKGTDEEEQASITDGRSQAGSSKQRDSSHLMWSCSACTFDNHNALPFCEICNTPRKNVTTRSQAKASVVAGGQTGSGASPYIGKQGNKQTSDITSKNKANPPDSSSDNIIMFDTSDVSDTTINDDVIKPVDDTITLITSTDSDGNTVKCNVTDNLDIEPASPMSIGGDSDVILDADSPCNSEDLFADCDTDDRLSLSDVRTSKRERNSDRNTSKTDLKVLQTNSSTTQNSDSENKTNAKDDGAQVVNTIEVSDRVDNNVVEVTKDEITSLSGTTDRLPSEEPPKDVVIKPTPIRLKRKRKSRHCRSASSDDSLQGKQSPRKPAVTRHNPNATPCQQTKSEEDVCGDSTPAIEDFSASEPDDIDLQGEENIKASQDKVELSIEEMKEGKDAEKQDNPSKQMSPSNHPISDSDPEPSEDDIPEPQVYESFLYCASKHTDRVYLYDQDQVPLQCYFFPLDVQHHDLDALPKILHHPDNLLLARRFVREWNSLNEIKRKQLRKSGYIFDSPIQAHEALKKGRPYEMCKKRFLTKEDLAKSALEKAKDVGGTVRVIAKPSAIRKKGVHSEHSVQPQSINTAQTRKSTSHPFKKQGPRSPVPSTARNPSDREDSCTTSGAESNLPGGSSTTTLFTVSSASEGHNSCDDASMLNSTSPVFTKRKAYLQVVDKDGCPLCLYCGKATISDSESAHRSAAWDRRYCSEQCKEEHGLRGKNTKFLREKLLEAEHGICQQCGFHAHDLFTQVRDIPKSQRKDLLKNSPYAKLPAQRLNDIIKNPFAGQFWHADHIVPVYEGGGLCSLDNLRTLCVMCHEKVTNEQNRQRRKQQKIQQQRQAGFGDITKFLKP